MNILFAQRTWVRSVPAKDGNVVSTVRRHPTASRGAGTQTGQHGSGTLRAVWTVNPATGRLACRWAPDEEVSDSRHGSLRPWQHREIQGADLASLAA
ncbi:hypothetical protein QO016_004931 [Methylobacterium persicinum]|jgi:hypothetical protein|uniref:Uncharacterized protein n=1 Tax=Methylobacterium persicinum TaxID=374426 RepID=A0ABU0HST1_9HYPH|nr:hypothetical protein [Methylobacterium persicinum]GJE36313.1 hypothetical protein KHHGKMAE_0361 [Methylobacterium persicinum]